MNLIINMVLASAAVYFTSKLWQYLEVLRYGTVQPDLIDTVITLVWVLFLFAAYFKGYLDRSSAQEREKPSRRESEARAMLMESEARKTAAEASRMEAEAQRSELENSEMIHQSKLKSKNEQATVCQFKTPVRVEDEESGYLVECKSFMDYAKAMMYPNPTYVVIPVDTQNLITTLINRGKIDIKEALGTCSQNYHYDDCGRDYIEFPDAREMLNLLRSCKSYRE